MLKVKKIIERFTGASDCNQVCVTWMSEKTRKAKAKKRNKHKATKKKRKAVSEKEEERVEEKQK